jgi:hypothetical protein
MAWVEAEVPDQDHIDWVVDWGGCFAGALASFQGRRIPSSSVAFDQVHQIPEKSSAASQDLSMRTLWHSQTASNHPAMGVALVDTQIVAEIVRLAEARVLDFAALGAWDVVAVAVAAVVAAAVVSVVVVSAVVAAVDKVSVGTAVVAAAAWRAWRASAEDGRSLARGASSRNLS